MQKMEVLERFGALRSELVGNCSFIVKRKDVELVSSSPDGVTVTVNLP